MIHLRGHTRIYGIKKFRSYIWLGGGKQLLVVINDHLGNLVLIFLPYIGFVHDTHNCVTLLSTRGLCMKKLLYFYHPLSARGYKTSTPTSFPLDQASDSLLPSTDIPLVYLTTPLLSPLKLGVSLVPLPIFSQYVQTPVYSI